MSANAPILIKAAKARYFAIALSENFPNTPEVTNELDGLEKAIRELQAGEVKSV